MNTTLDRNAPFEFLYLTDVVGRPVKLRGENVGRVEDFLIVDRDRLADVTHLCISRPFGRHDCVVPWERVSSFSRGEVVVDVENLETYAAAPPAGSIWLKDYILDKKVMDVKGREVEVVYDVQMIFQNRHLFVVHVDLSWYGLLRRIGLEWLAKLIYKSGDKIRRQTVSWRYIEPLPEGIGRFKGDLRLKVLKEQFAELPPEDLADILEEIDHEQRLAIFGELGSVQASDILEELDPKVQRELVASIPKEKAAHLVGEMTPGQAADLLSVLPWPEVRAILRLLDKDVTAKIERILQKHDEKVTDFATARYLRLSPTMTVSAARAEFRRQAQAKEAVEYLYVLTDEDQLVGMLELKELLLADDETLVKDIMGTKIIQLHPQNTLKQASNLFTRYRFRALPIVGENDKMLGLLLQRDVADLHHLYLE
jgi:CBS domain-containing protein/sporulation protein YlmC with PRC-barrel domain